MKRGTTPTLKINIPGIDVSEIDHIDFIFKASKSETAPAIIEKSYPDTVSFDGNVFLMPFTEAETRLFNDYRAYMDTRIITRDGKIPATQIIEIDVRSTLFGEVENHD